MDRQGSGQIMGAPVRANISNEPTSEIDQSITNADIIAGELDKHVELLRSRLQTVLRPQPPGNGAGQKEDPRPMKSNLADRVDSIASRNQNTLQNIISLMNELAL